MTPDDGEDDDAPLGPPPDPSLRQWRHPSEIASANAAALRDISPVREPRWRSMSFIGGWTIGLIGVVVLGTAVVRPFTSDIGDTALQTTSTPAWLAVGEGDTSPTTTQAPTGGDGVSLPDDADTSDDATSTTTITQVVASSTLPPALEADASGVIGILDLDDESLVASGLVVDGMVLTSAHALDGRLEVLLRTGDRHIRGVVVGTDPFTDLAVVATLEPDQLPDAVQMAAASSTEGLEMGSTVWVLAASEQSTPTIIGGEVTAIDENVMTSSGTVVFDALQTTIRTPVSGPGGAVVDENGATIAMVVACDRHLASALPIGMLRATAESIRETGWAHIGWLGLEGEGSSDGVELVSIEPDGPAAMAGLIAGDVLVSVDGEPLQHIAGIVRAIRAAGVGNEVEIEVERGDETLLVSITVGTRIG